MGKHGIVTIEPSIGPVDPTLHVMQGLRFDRGFISDAFVNSPHTAECRLEKPLIFLCDYQLKALPDALPLLELVARAGRPLLIVGRRRSRSACDIDRECKQGQSQFLRGKGTWIWRPASGTAR